MERKWVRTLASTVPIAVLIVAVGVGAAIFHDRNSHHAARSKSTASAVPTGTPADQGTASGVPVPSGTPTAISTACIARKHNRTITVVTYNIHSARNPRGRVDLSGIASELAAMKPDVVLLQEVDRGRQWTARLDMPKVLGSDLDMAWTFGANVVRTPTNQYGTAILSRFPIKSTHNTELPRPGGTQQRGLLHAVIDVHGTPVSIYDVHLEAHSALARIEQIRVVSRIVAADSRPKLLGGDFNSPPRSNVLGVARSGLSDTWLADGSGPGLTAPGEAPRIRIDYLLYADGSGSHATRIEPQGIQVMGQSAVSDHRAVRAVYRLREPAGKICVPKLK